MLKGSNYFQEIQRIVFLEAKAADTNTNLAYKKAEKTRTSDCMYAYAILTAEDIDLTLIRKTAANYIIVYFKAIKT